MQILLHFSEFYFYSVVHSHSFSMSEFIRVHIPLVLTEQHINVNYFMYCLSDDLYWIFFLGSIFSDDTS